MRNRFVEIIRSIRPVRCVVVLLVSVGVLLADSSVVFAQTDDKCKIPDAYKGKWSEPEEWAWWRICRGQIADFNNRPGNEKLDPRNPEHDHKWSDIRKLSPDFLRTILLNEPFRSAIPHRGVRISGAYFINGINLRDASIERPLALRRSLFKSAVDMNRFTTTKFVSFTDSKFEGTFEMDSVSIESNLFMRNARFKEVRLTAAKISGGLILSNSNFKGMLYMSAASVGKDLFMWRAKLDKPVVSKFLKVGLNLDVRGATLSRLDLMGAQIQRTLWLGHFREKEFKWKVYKDRKGTLHNPKLTLRNASVGTLQDSQDSWPDNLEREFDGFIYQRLGGLGSSEEKLSYHRKSKWFIEWLAKDKSYSPQPYQHLASVLRAAGYSWKADNILYAGRARAHREREMSWNEWLFQWLLWLLISYGYGLRNFVALAWVLGLATIGMIFLRCKMDIDKFLLHVNKKITKRGSNVGSLLSMARNWKKICGAGIGFLV